LPRYTGQPTAKARGTFTIAPPDYPSMFISDAASGTLELQLKGTGTTTLFLEWVPLAAQGDASGVPGGYWRATRIVYRFD
jgi:hypothetical protein